MKNPIGGKFKDEESVSKFNENLSLVNLSLGKKSSILKLNHFSTETYLTLCSNRTLHIPTVLI
jgi:hypothetical protein